MKWIVLIAVIWFSLATAQECGDFDSLKAEATIVKAHPYAGSVTVKRVGNLYQLGVPWEKVQGYGVQQLEVIPTRGRDVGQPFAYTDADWCHDSQVKFASFDGKKFWISFPRWMLNGGCYVARIYRWGVDRESIETRQYDFCFNP